METNEVQDRSERGAAQMMQLFKDFNGIRTEPTPEQQQRDAEFFELLQQRQVEDLLDQLQQEFQTQIDQQGMARNQAMLVEAQNWFETIQAKDALNAVQDGIHWVRICTPEGSRCWEGEGQIENNRLLLTSSEHCLNKSRAISNGRIIIDSTFFGDQGVGFDNLFCFLMYESELPHPH